MSSRSPTSMISTRCAEQSDIFQAIRRHGRPTLIIVKTQIGWGAPEQAVGTAAAHGAPLGPEESRPRRPLTAQPRGQRLPRCPKSAGTFQDGVGTHGPGGKGVVAGEVRRIQGQVRQRGRPNWNDLLAGEAAPRAGTPIFKTFEADAKGMASRASLGKVSQPGCRKPALASGRIGRPGSLDQSNL